MDGTEDPALPAPPPATRIGWRAILTSHDFLRDILVTTLGVLLALAIGEAADDVRWNARTAEAERQLRHEGEEILFGMSERIIVRGCIDLRVAALREIFRDGQATGRLPRVERVGRPPLRPYPIAAWQSALGEGLVARMDRDVAMTFRTLSESASELQTIGREELDAWGQLRLIEDRAGPWPAALTANLESALIVARDRNRFAQLIASQALEGGRKAKILPRETGAASTIGPAELEKAAATRKICQPLMVDGRPYRLKGPLPPPEY